MYSILMNLVLSGVLLMSFWFKCSTSADWCYHGPCANWNATCKTGMKQSPIDLNEDPSATVQNWEIDFSPAYCNNVKGIMVVNSGHGVQARRENIPTVSPTLSMKGSAFGATISNSSITYNFLQFHVHWGSADGVGSEHTVAGKHHSLEIHMVHRKTFNGDGIVGNDSDTLAVLGIFFEVDTSEEDNKALTPILDTFVCINNTIQLNFPYKFKTTNFLDLFPKDLSVFRYDGSLTTPPCGEVVLWTVFKTPSRISKKQMKMFRDMQTRGNFNHTSGAISNNFRPVQPLNGRNITSAVLKVTGACADKV